MSTMQTILVQVQLLAALIIISYTGSLLYEYFFPPPVEIIIEAPRAPTVMRQHTIPFFDI